MSIVDVASALAVGVAQTVLKPVRPDPGPATARWGVGVGEYAAGRMPGVVRGLARELNRFGSVIVSPAVIEFDGHEVPWSKVTEIKTRRLVGYLLTDAITQGVDRLPIWRFPGRGLVLSGLSHTALTAVAVAADLRLDRGVFTLYLPAEVQSKGLIRRKQMSPGFPAALVLTDPAGALLSRGEAFREAAAAAIARAFPQADEVFVHQHVVALERAVQQMNEASQAS
jgi:hypothetical protein